MATDSKGKAVGFGDWVAVLETTDGKATVCRIVKFAETPKGIRATGAYVELVGNGRVVKRAVDVAASTLVMKSDGTVNA